jgi:hypothetical protein
MPGMACLAALALAAAIAGCSGKPEPAAPASEPDVASEAATVAAAEAAKKEEAQDERIFGTHAGEPIDSGFIFINGAYIEPPYIVSTRGAGVYVNGVLERRLSWRQNLPPVPDKEPDLPTGLTKDSTFSDPHLKDSTGRYLDGIWLNWLEMNCSEEEARRRFRDWWLSVPFVKNATYERNGGSLLVETLKGDKVYLGFGWMPGRQSVSHSLWVARKDLSDELNHVQNLLKEGSCFFVFDGEVQASLSYGDALLELPAAVEVLRSGRTPSEKASALEAFPRLGKLDEGGYALSPLKVGCYPSVLNRLAAGFRASPELEKRLARLVAEDGVKPLSLDQIPRESDFARAARAFLENRWK